MKNVLVTGGAGFIGSNLVHLLKKKGVAVTVVDDLLTGRADNLPPGTPLERIDCASDAFRESFGGQPWDTIVHLGGASSAPLFDENPMRMAQAVRAFQNSLEVARRCGARVAFASTSSFYARCPKPYREEMAITPATLYECSKLSMENLAQTYAASYGVPCAALRFFSVYGPRERGKGRFANVVSQFLWSMKGGRAPVLYGDGNQTRDFTHVEDLLRGLTLALEKTEGFTAYNIGTGVEHTFNQVVEKLNFALGTKLRPTYVPNPVRNYVQETLADNSRLRRLGWLPSITLDQGIRRLVAEDGAVDAELLERIAA
ncbi:MAG: NAD-dependent epimerase/dehydratase family protein [Thermoplasmatota archaeon]